MPRKNAADVQAAFRDVEIMAIKNDALWQRAQYDGRSGQRQKSKKLPHWHMALPGKP
jgi:hypothetical protein